MGLVLLGGIFGLIMRFAMLKKLATWINDINLQLLNGLNSGFLFPRLISLPSILDVDRTVPRVG